MTLRLLLVLTVLCLSACVTTSGRNDSPASDLDVLASNAARDLRTTLLSNGREYCAELATTEEAQDACMSELEAAVFSSNRDKERALVNLRKAIKRLKLARAPCSLWERMWRAERCAVD